MQVKRLLIRGLALCWISLLLAMTSSVYAASIEVRDGCSLSDAIHAANLDQAFGGCPEGDGDDIIYLKESVETSDPMPWITSNIAIRGDNREFRVSAYNYAFTAQYANLTLSNLKVTFMTPRSGRVLVMHDGRLIVDDTTFSNCSGGIYQENSRTIIRGDSNICDLPESAYVVGGDSVEIDLTPPPVPRTCDALADSGVTVAGSLGVQCQQVSGGGIGIPSVIDAGVLDAVDVWGYIGQGVEICFPQAGTITFLDAATSPRSIAPVETYRRGDATCAFLNRPGTVVLAPGQTTAERAVTTTETVTTTPVTTTTVTTGGDSRARHRWLPHPYDRSSQAARRAIAQRRNHGLRLARLYAGCLVPESILVPGYLPRRDRLDRRQICGWRARLRIAARQPGDRPFKSPRPAMGAYQLRCLQFARRRVKPDTPPTAIRRCA